MFAGDEKGAGFGRLLSEIEAYVGSLDPEAFAPEDVPVVVSRLARAEKLCGAGKLLMARRASKLQAGSRSGQTSSAKWLAEASGIDLGRARQELETASRLGSQPEVESALRSGAISPTQAALIAPAVEADPGAARSLISTAGSEHLGGLRDAAERVMAAARSQEEALAREERLRQRRHLRFGVSREGAVCLRGELPPLEGAVVRRAVESISREVFAEARRDGRHEPHEAYMADALVRLCRRDASERPSGGPRADLVLHVSAEALRRGSLREGERCEIEGVGPVSLTTVEDLFGNAWAKLVISRGVDVAHVTHFGRTIPAHVMTALVNRDTTCQVPGCGITYGLECDHVVPFAEGGPTELSNLARICHRHHLMKTYEGWRLLGAPGAWEWVRPAPPHAGEPPALTGEPALAGGTDHAAPLAPDARGRPLPGLAGRADYPTLPLQQTLAYAPRGLMVTIRIRPAELAAIEQAEATDGQHLHAELAISREASTEATPGANPGKTRRRRPYSSNPFSGLVPGLPESPHHDSACQVRSATVAMWRRGPPPRLRESPVPRARLSRRRSYRLTPKPPAQPRSPSVPSRDRSSRRR